VRLKPSGDPNVAVDTEGWLLPLVVTAASISDRARSNLLDI